MSSTSIDRNRNILNDILGTIGQTPLVYLNRITKDLPAKIAVKCEYFNPALSIKDRVGNAMIEDAEKKGLITPGKTVLIEPTSGNMGIGLAFAAAVKGYPMILVMPSSMSLERRTLLIAYGAALILTEPARAVEGALERCKELLEIIPNSYMLNQFANTANIDAHYNTTGPEIWKQTQGKVDVCCFGVGSGGTVVGVSKYLKERKPSVKMYAVEPYEASVINGFKHAPHKIPGMGAGFIPPILDSNSFEEALRVKSDEAIEMAKRLAKEEGILAGISGGANIVAAIKLAKRPENKNKLIVTSLASFGERYLSTDLYSKVKEECGEMKVNDSVHDDIKYLKEKLSLNF